MTSSTSIMAPNSPDSTAIPFPAPRSLSSATSRWYSESATAGPNEILISEPFYQALKHPPKVEALEPIQVKGKTKKVPVYRANR